jgi:hypothetical protein
MPSWVVEEWNDLESNHFYSSSQIVWDFFNKFSKQTLLGCSFDSLKSLNVYSPRQGIRLPFFNRLLKMALYGAQGRV